MNLTAAAVLATAGDWRPTLQGTLGLDPWFGFDMGTIHWIFRVPDGGSGSLTVGRHPVVPVQDSSPATPYSPWMQFGRCAGCPDSVPRPEQVNSKLAQLSAAA